MESICHSFGVSTTQSARNNDDANSSLASTTLQQPGNSQQLAEDVPSYLVQINDDVMMMLRLSPGTLSCYYYYKCKLHILIIICW